MIEWFLEHFEKLIGVLNILAALSAGAIWALVASALFAYLCWSKKEQIQSDKGWKEIREKQIVSETAQTEVLRRQTEEIVGFKMILTKYLIKE